MQVVLLANLSQKINLGLEEVDMLLAVIQNFLLQIARDVVTNRLAVCDSRLDGRLRTLLQGQIGPQDLGYVLANMQLAKVLQIWQSVEHEYSIWRCKGCRTALHTCAS